MGQGPEARRQDGRRLQQSLARGHALTPRGIDHLVVAARTLEEGAAWIESRLGAVPVAGGKHSAMGTHNRLVSLGPECYLEVIAIDPGAPPPARPRWFELDTPAMRERLAGGPALIHWVERSLDLDADLALQGEGFRAESFSRGAYRWRLALAPDGRLPGAGRLPTLIEWQGPHPCEALPDPGVRLLGLRYGGHALEADFSTALGLRRIP